MKRIRLLTKISLQYWGHHKRRLFVLMISLIIGVAALCGASLLICSEKEAVLERELCGLGDYDVIVVDLEKDQCGKLAQIDQVLDYGTYLELGYAGMDEKALIKVAAFPDVKSETMYHMTCLRGHYPENENEVALDLLTAKSLGLKPYPGENVTLKLFSLEKKELGEKEYTVSGIFEGSDPSVAGGWYRYPLGKGIGEYSMPGVFFFSEWNNFFQSDRVTMFIQTDTKETGELSTLIMEAGESEGEIDWEQIDVPPGRSYAYAYVLGVVMNILDQYGGSISMDDIKTIIRNGEGIKDFYSQIVMPIFTVLIVIIVILSVFGITRNVIRDKKEEFAILRSLGMESYNVVSYLFCDFFLLGVVSIVLGLAVGSVMHIGMIRYLNLRMEPQLVYGFSCSEYVKEVTVNPFVYAPIVIFLCLIVAVSSSVVFMVKKTPVEMFQATVRKKRAGKLEKTVEVIAYKSWKKLLMNKLDLYDHVVAVVTMILLGTALLGYTYFQAYADDKNSEFKSEKEESGLGDCDYIGQKSDEIYLYQFQIENHHECGLDSSAYDELAKQKFVKKAYAEIVNRSMRMTFDDKSLSQQQREYLEILNLRKYANVDEEDSFELSLQDAENAMIREVGYADDELVYSLPTVALDENSMRTLEKRVVEGTMDEKKIKSGEEILLVTIETEQEKLRDLFHVGDTIPASDILLNEKEEMYDFGYGLTETMAEPVYKEWVTTPEGAEVELSSYAFGKRVDVPVKVGAIAVLTEEEAKKYMVSPDDFSDTYIFNAFCLPESFAAWNLPNDKYTKVGIELVEGVDIAEVDSYWYGIFSKTNGMKTTSTAEIIAKMNAGTGKIMGIYYSMIILLLLIAIVAIAIRLYTNIRIKSQKIAILRACGMTTSQIFYLIIRQNLFYPVVGIVFSVVPVALCQGFFLYIQRIAGNSVWVDDTPWYFEVPYWHNLFDSRFAVMMVVLFVVDLLLTLLVTLPQIYYVKQQVIVEEIEKSDF